VLNKAIENAAKRGAPREEMLRLYSRREEQHKNFIERWGDRIK
jgi:hypothetical protein